MVWTKHDFEREVRRQIVEIASIRKRLPATSDLLPRINLLEASHRNILRKLKEFGDPGPEPRKVAAKPEARAALKPAALKPLDLRALRRETRTGQGVRATCPSCGQSLGSSRVGAMDVIYHNHAWYHRRCAARSGMN